MTLRNKILLYAGFLLLVFFTAGFLIPNKIILQEEKCTDVPVKYLQNVLQDLSMFQSWNGVRFPNTPNDKPPGAPIKGNGATLEIIDGEKILGSVSLQFQSSDSIIYLTTTDKKPEKSVFTFTSGETQNCISARVEIYKSFPGNIIGFISAIGYRKKLKKSLDQLIKIGEKRYSEGMYRGYKINETSLNETYYVTMRSEIKLESIKQFYTQNISALYQALLDAGVNSTGMPCALFFKWNETSGTTDMAAAIPVLSEVLVKDTGTFKISSRRALIIDFYGDNSKTANAHFAMDDYMADRGLLQDVPVIEEYVTDPTKEPDVNKWLTKIIYLPAE